MIASYMQNITENFGWLEIAFFYSIAIGVCFWQWWKMRREVREMRAEREAKEAIEREAEEAAHNDAEESERPPES